MTTPDTRAEVERLEDKGRAEGLTGAAISLQRIVDYWDGRPLRMHGEHIHADVLDVLRAIRADASRLLADTRPAEPARGVIVCTNCDADDLGCTACGAHGTLTAPQPHADTVETVEWALFGKDNGRQIGSPTENRNIADRNVTRWEYNGMPVTLKSRTARVGPWEPVS